MEMLQPPGWPRAKGYSNGIAAKGTMVFTAGLVGWNEKEEFETDDFAGQARQAFENIVAVLAEAGAKPEHIVRITWYVGDKAEYLGALREVSCATEPGCSTEREPASSQPGEVVTHPMWLPRVRGT